MHLFADFCVVGRFIFHKEVMHAICERTCPLCERTCPIYEHTCLAPPLHPHCLFHLCVFLHADLKQVTEICWHLSWSYLPLPCSPSWGHFL